MWQFLFQTYDYDYWPLLVDFALGFVVVTFVRSVAWLFLIWALTPIFAAMVYAAPSIIRLSGRGGDGAASWMMAGVVVLVQGIFIFGIGGLFGIPFRRRRAAR
jgi:hypothetical protein